MELWPHSVRDLLTVLKKSAENHASYRRYFAVAHEFSNIFFSIYGFYRKIFMNNTIPVWLNYLSYITLVMIVALSVRLLLKKQILGAIISSLISATTFLIFIVWYDGYIDPFIPIAFVVMSSIAFAVSWAIYWLFDFFNKKK